MCVQVEMDLTLCGLLLLECPLKPYAKRVRVHFLPTGHRRLHHLLRVYFSTILRRR